MKTYSIKQLNNISKQIRCDLIEMTYNTGYQGAHIAGSLSLVEILTALYFNILNFDPKNPDNENRDRFILSKGHGVMTQYAIFKQIGLITKEELLTYKKNNSLLSAHPCMNKDLGIEFSSGSLGQGLSLAVGCALALKHNKNLTSKVYVLLGDGECNEGSVWESAMSASHYNLDNLIVIIDRNFLQYDDKTENIIKLEPFKNKWESFGFITTCTDGHNIEELIKAFQTQHKQKPLCIIANTIKGKGISFMENEAKWHNGVLTKDLYGKTLIELGV